MGFLSLLLQLWGLWLRLAQLLSLVVPLVYVAFNICFQRSTANAWQSSCRLLHVWQCVVYGALLLVDKDVEPFVVGRNNKVRRSRLCQEQQLEIEQRKKELQAFDLGRAVQRESGN